MRLSPILPVVLAQDKRSWKISARFGDLFALTQQRWEEVGAFTPNFAFRLLQLVDIPYERIGGTAEGILTLRALKAEAVGELLHEAVWEPGLLQAVSLEAAERFFRYMLNAGIDKQTFERRVRHGAGRPPRGRGSWDRRKAEMLFTLSPQCRLKV